MRSRQLEKMLLVIAILNMIISILLIFYHIEWICGFSWGLDLMLFFNIIYMYTNYKERNERNSHMNKIIVSRMKYYIAIVNTIRLINKAIDTLEITPEKKDEVLKSAIDILKEGLNE